MPAEGPMDWVQVKMILVDLGSCACTGEKAVSTCIRVCPLGVLVVVQLSYQMLEAVQNGLNVL